MTTPESLLPLEALGREVDAGLLPASVVEQNGRGLCALEGGQGERLLAVFTAGGDAEAFFPEESRPVSMPDGSSWSCSLASYTPSNAAALRGHFDWLNPVPLRLKTSFGFGDRLGMATQGHVHAVKNTGIAPIFAQQSVRENSRIGRTPQEVLDDAMWGVLQEGWQESWGADADHVKEVTDLEAFVEAGYTFFTIDPSDHVDNAAQADDIATLRTKSAGLPWSTLESDVNFLRRRYTRSFGLEGRTLSLDEETFLRALCKYGRALAHAVTVSRSLRAQMDGRPFELEFSVDETDTPTSVAEHYFIAGELARLDVPVVSLAPRFIGKFEKGVDYMGDLVRFRQDLEGHAAVVRYFDRYKLSVHTGSDKFSIYPILAELTGGRVHVKTAGTSYLEALRVIAREDTGFFREILDYAHERFPTDRKTYYLSCDPSEVPRAGDVEDKELPDLLNQFHARQVLHVTFGSILDRYGERFHTAVRSHDEAYADALERHFRRHLEPFVAYTGSRSG